MLSNKNTQQQMKTIITTTPSFYFFTPSSEMLHVSPTFFPWKKKRSKYENIQQYKQNVLFFESIH